MPRYMKLRDVRALTYTEFERWWEVDFNVLVPTAIAEATGEVHPTVTAALRSDDWLEQWADALYAASGELDSSVERMTYTRDGRLEQVKHQAGVVHQRMGQVNGLLKGQRREQGWEMLGDHFRDARLMALSILAKHHLEESGLLRAEELVQRGLSPRPPLWEASYADGLEAIEDAVRHQLIQAPISAGVRALQSAPQHRITSVVAQDVKYQQERCDAPAPAPLGRGTGTPARPPLCLGRHSARIHDVLGHVGLPDAAGAAGRGSVGHHQPAPVHPGPRPAAP